MSVTFDGVELQRPELFEKDLAVLSNETRLLSGKISAQISTETGLNVTFLCNATAESQVTALQAKIGTFATLSIDGTDHTNCYISAFKHKEIMTDNHEYTVSFKRKTV